MTEIYVPTSREIWEAKIAYSIVGTFAFAVLSTFDLWFNYNIQTTFIIIAILLHLYTWYLIFVENN